LQQNHPSSTTKKKSQNGIEKTLLLSNTFHLHIFQGFNFWGVWLFFVFVWWFWFTAFHMSVCVLVCLFGLGCFLLADGVWQTSFLPQKLHASMLKHQSCACETARRLKISPQESNKKQNKQKTNNILNH
jgi:hypothetical protein